MFSVNMAAESCSFRWFNSLRYGGILPLKINCTRVMHVVFSGRVPRNCAAVSNGKWWECPPWSWSSVDLEGWILFRRGREMTAENKSIQRKSLPQYYPASKEFKIKWITDGCAWHGQCPSRKCSSSSAWFWAPREIEHSRAFSFAIQSIRMLTSDSVRPCNLNAIVLVIRSINSLASVHHICVEVFKFQLFWAVFVLD